MYADDLIILSASLSGLKAMLTNCLHTFSQLSLSLNASKSCCLHSGPRCNTVLDNLVLGNAKITWNSLFKYLGIHFVNGKKISVNIEPIRHNFFMSCNDIQATPAVSVISCKCNCISRMCCLLLLMELN